MTNKSAIIQRINVMLCRRCDPDGLIESDRLFEVLAERIGRIEKCDRSSVVEELKKYGVILGEQGQHPTFRYKIRRVEILA